MWLTFPATIFCADAQEALNAGHGRVSMQGSIIDVPCAIAVESREQTIDLITTSLEQVIRDGASPPMPFSIRLENCILQSFTPGLQEWSHFSVTFEGPVSDGRLFALKGEACGIGLEISDADGNPIQPGVASRPGPILPGTMRLNYSLRLIGNHQRLRAGEYYTTVRFKLDYF